MRRDGVPDRSELTGERLIVRRVRIPDGPPAFGRTGEEEAVQTVFPVSLKDLFNGLFLVFLSELQLNGGEYDEGIFVHDPITLRADSDDGSTILNHFTQNVKSTHG